MFGAFVAISYFIFSWLFSLPIARFAPSEFLFLWRWYAIWAVIGGIYAIYSVVVATWKHHGLGCLGIIGSLIFYILLTGLVWVLHYGSLLWGAHILMGLVANFNWWHLAGAIGLILLGCVMQAVELFFIDKV